MWKQLCLPSGCHSWQVASHLINVQLVKMLISWLIVKWSLCKLLTVEVGSDTNVLITNAMTRGFARGSR